MPKIDVKGTRLYYESHGEGYPLVLIRGVGSNADHWYEQVPAFSSRYRVIVFDNRGIGRSDTPAGPCTISMMADDTIGLLDALDISTAHILGISMGGMIAQIIALNHPGRVKGLVLGCTHCGGAHAVIPANRRPDLRPENLYTGSGDAAQTALNALFSERTPRESPEVIERYLEVSSAFPPSPETLKNQRQAVQGHDTWEKLPEISSPTLILNGNDDALIPPENASILLKRIPNSVLHIIEGGGHQFLIEQPDVSNRIILEFLDSLKAAPQG